MPDDIPFFLSASELWWFSGGNLEYYSELFPAKICTVINHKHSHVQLLMTCCFSGYKLGFIFIFMFSVVVLTMTSTFVCVLINCSVCCILLHKPRNKQSIYLFIYLSRFMFVWPIFSSLAVLWIWLPVSDCQLPAKTKCATYFAHSFVLNQEFQKLLALN